MTIQEQNNKVPAERHQDKGLFEKLLSRSRTRLGGAVLIGLVVVFLYFAFGWLFSLGGSADYEVPMYEVEKDMMRVTVSAGGTLQAMRSHAVESKVEGSTQILEIIPEGTIITDADLEKGTVLMQLDASSARDNLEQQKITVQDASASYTQAKEDHTIQREQNESDIAQAELALRFATMELKRYLGDELARRAIERELDFDADDWQGEIGGAALQERRRMENAVSLASEEMTRTEESLHWTRELVERGYVNRNELVADELEKKRRGVELESAEENLELFLRYTLVKEAEERLSDYVEGIRNLERTRARARGRMAQSEANLRSREASFRLQEERLERLHQMIENSTVMATRPGLVVYASTTNPRQFRNSPVEEGLSVREGQTVLSIPDLSTLAARVEVPETQAQTVRPGQKARISVDAIPDKSWQGEVRRVSPMATQQTGFRALTGGSSGYETDVAFLELSNPDNDLKPGMSATVEIEVVSIPEAISVPIHAVHTRDGRRMCWVDGRRGPELREVRLGFYTDTHVQIIQGLETGERIFLVQPEHSRRDLRIVTLPEMDAGEEGEIPGELEIYLPDSSGETEAIDERLEELLAELDPETRERVRRRIQNNPEIAEEMMERLQDPDAREQMMRRTQDPERSGGRGERQTGDRRSAD